MGLADHDPRLNLGQVVIVVHEHSWLRYLNGRECTDNLVAMEGVHPGYVVVPYTGILILSISVVLAREAVVVRIETLDDPPISFNVTHISKIFLSIFLRNLAYSIIWHLVSAFMTKDTVGELCKISNVSGLFDLTIEITAWLCLITFSDTSKCFNASQVGETSLSFPGTVIDNTFAHLDWRECFLNGWVLNCFVEGDNLFGKV